MGVQTCSTCGTSNQSEARFCSSCGTNLTVQPVEGERRLVTVLFADVVGSTALAEQLDPEDYSQIMNGAYGFMNAAVTRYEGTITRLLGDAIIALFGAPVAHEEDAERAIRAALEIADSAGAYARVVAREYRVDFALRVGISTGTVVLAVVGDSARSEYTALGDAANVAARLQALTRPGTVAIDMATRRLVHPLFDIESRGLVEVKGKREPVAYFEVTGVRAVPGRVRGLEGLASPVVGRERELGVLRALLDDLSRGAGSVAALVGDAGLGKSRLIAELRACRAPGSRWLEARAISYGQLIPYHQWRQLGRQFIGAAEADPSATVQEKLRAFVRDAEMPTSDLPFLETMLAVETEESRRALADMTGDSITAGAARAVVTAIRSAFQANGGTPHVLVMEDLHWADHASLELLAQVVRLTESQPLVLICSLRPDPRARSQALIGRLAESLGGRFTRVDLEPLDRGAAEELVGNLLGVAGLTDEVRALILDRSEGNPFYIEEVLRSLIDSGQVVHDGSRWCLTGDLVETIPDTLSGVLSARIDRLPDQTKRVVQTASVIGRVFGAQVLESVCQAAPNPVAPVDPHLATLISEQLVRQRASEPGREFSFKHALTCEAAYQLLLRSRRRQLHALCGAALEELYPDRQVELAPVLAYHFSQAREDLRARTYYRLAADNARRLYALTEELQHREAILAIADAREAADDEAISDVLEWVILRHRLNRYDGVVERLERTLATARALGDDRHVAEVLSWLGNIHMVTGFPSRSVPYLLESREIAQRLGEDRLLLLPLWIGTWTLVDRDPEAAVDALTQVIELAHAEHATDVEAHARGDLSNALARLGRFDEAHAEIERALALAPRAGSPVKEADVHIAVGQSLRQMGELEAALAHSRKGAESALAANGLECACAGFYGVGRSELDLEDPDGAIDDFDRSLSIGERAHISQSSQFHTLTRAGRAMAAFRRGDSAAIDTLRRTRDEAERSHDAFGAGTISEQLGEALVSLGEVEAAQEPLAYAIAVYRELGTRPFLARALELTAELRDQLGDAEGAEVARAEATDLRTTIAAGTAAPPSLGEAAVQSVPRI